MPLSDNRALTANHCQGEMFYKRITNTGKKKLTHFLSES